MFYNYLKIGVRYLLKNRTFSAINIFGLTLGFLCFMVIMLYVHDELSYDQFHSDSGKIFRIIQHEKTENGTVRDVAPIAPRVAEEASRQISEIEEMTRISGLGRITVGNEPANRTYERVITTDENFFTFFDFPLIQGDRKTALSTPDGIVISEKVAIRNFGNENAMGKRLWTSLTREDGRPVEMVVTGIMKDFPTNSHLQLDIIFSPRSWPTIFPWYNEFMNSDWESNTHISYVKLRSESKRIGSTEDQLTQLVKKNFPIAKQFRSDFSLQPLKDIHLYSDNIQGSTANLKGMNPFYIYLFSAVALLVLLIAALNYMNLSTAAAYKRTKEIGTRKTLGAFKMQLMGQFIGEAAILTTISFILAVSVLQVVLPFVNTFTEKQMNLNDLPMEWIYAILLTVATTTLLASIYPAVIISRVKPAAAMKKDVKFAGRALPVRKLLIVAQFAIAILMISSTLIISEQLTFMKNKDLGFSLDNLLVVDINSSQLRRNYQNVKAEFASVGEVERVTTSTRVPGEWKSFPIASARTAGMAEGVDMIYVGIDQDFMKAYDIRLLEGRNFVDSNSDSLKVILTKLAVEQLNLTDPVGQIIEIPSYRQGGSIEQLQQPIRAEVIGVADNFHFESFRQKMMPLIFAYPNTAIQRIDYYTLKINTQNWDETIAKLKQVNNKLDPNNPMEYTFLNGQFETFYRADEKRGQTFMVFSVIIVVISCMGLFALVSFAIENRLKEIGIRKVLGASVTSIVSLVSREFLMLVMIAGVIAIPVAYWLMQNWLSDFAYRIPLSAGLFISAALLAMIIAFITIGVRTLQAATSNPVDSLRNE